MRSQSQLRNDKILMILNKCTFHLYKRTLCKHSENQLKFVHVSKFFWGVAGSEDFACATLPTTPLDFEGKVQNVSHPTLLKIRFKISVTPPPPPPLHEKGQSQNYGASVNSNGLLTLSGLLSLRFLLHMTTSFIKENHFNNCI